MQAVPRPKLLEHARGSAWQSRTTWPSLPRRNWHLPLIWRSTPRRRDGRAPSIAWQSSMRDCPGEAALVLNGLSRSWLSVFQVQAPHPEAGFILEDAMLGGEAWVVDEALADQAEPGTVLATRLARVNGFAITCGVVAVLDETMLARLHQLVRGGEIDPAELVGEPRFAERMWLHALGSRVG